MALYAMGPLTMGLFLVLVAVTSGSPLPEEEGVGLVRSHWSVDSVQPVSRRGGRQFGGLGDLGKVVDSVGKFDLREVSKFLKEIPELFESVEKIVEGVDTSFGEGD